MWMWSMWASVRLMRLRRFPRSVKQAEYLLIPSEPDHHEWQFQMISWMPIRRARACSLPALSVASQSSISRRASRRSAARAASRCQSTARPSACSDARPLPQRSQRMIPLDLPGAFRSSQPTSASAPGVARVRQSRAWSYAYSSIGRSASRSAGLPVTPRAEPAGAAARATKRGSSAERKRTPPLSAETAASVDQLEQPRQEPRAPRRVRQHVQVLLHRREGRDEQALLLRVLADPVGAMARP